MTPPSETITLAAYPDGSRLVLLLWHERPDFPCARCPAGWFAFGLLP